MASAVARRRVGFWGAAALLTVGGCAQIFGIDEWTPADGGAPPDWGAGGGDQAPAGSCAVGELAQTAGDCRRDRCDASGEVVSDPDPGDLPDDGLACTEDGCQGGTAVHMPLPAGAPCSGGVCNGQGACVECVLGAQCPSGVCAEFACLAPACGDHVQNGAETDVDCGGDCGKRCEEGDGCLVDDDCKKGKCKDGVCED